MFRLIRKIQCNHGHSRLRGCRDSGSVTGRFRLAVVASWRLFRIRAVADSPSTGYPTMVQLHTLYLINLGSEH